MKRILIVSVPLLLLCGCAGVLKTMFGINEDGTQTPGGGVLGTVASVVNYWIPGVSILAGGVTTVVAALRAGKWKEAFTSTAKVIEAGSAAGKAVVDIKQELAVAHSAAGVRGLVDKVVQKISEEKV